MIQKKFSKWETGGESHGWWGDLQQIKALATKPEELCEFDSQDPHSERRKPDIIGVLCGMCVPTHTQDKYKHSEDFYLTVPHTSAKTIQKQLLHSFSAFKFLL